VLWVTDVSALGGAADQRPEQFPGSDVWLIENKVDLAAQRCGGSHTDKNEYKFNSSISAMTGQGTDALAGALAAFAKDYFASTDSAIVTRVRHRRALEDTVAALDRAMAQAAKSGAHEELIAEELRAAATSLGRLTGRVDVEDILDVIFRDFCIGK
jgi:tRNA modification GTPase